MQDHQGIFLVLEGSDGSGKTTQFELLQKRLTDAGYKIAVFDFPRYNQPSSYFVKRYLNGEYGPASKINPYTASLFFAMDRYEAGPAIKRALAEGKIVLSNRYVGSNMAHQGSKFDEPIEKRSFFVWEDSLEYQLLNIPRPHLNLFLRVPAKVSYELITLKNARSYTDKSHDEHEADINHLSKSVETYDLLCQLFPRDFKAIECAPDGELLTIEEISNLIWANLSPLLPKPKTEPKPPAVQVAKPVVAEKKIETADFNWKIESLSLLAQNQLLLAGIRVRANNTWTGNKAKYSYFLPDRLDDTLKKKYVETMTAQARLHGQALAKLANHPTTKAKAAAIMAAATPLAATASAEITISKKSALSVLGKMRVSPYPEVIKLARDLQDEIKKYWPNLLKTDEQNPIVMPQAVGDIIKKLSLDMLPQKLPAQSDNIHLLESLPRNEFDLIADSLYPFSNLSRSEIAAEVEDWDYQKKQTALKTALSNPQTNALQLAKYRFDFLTDWLSLSNCLKERLVFDVQMQPGSPRFGYDVPEAVEEAKAEDEYLDIFDKSLGLYSLIQTQTDSDAVEYAVMAGHRLRWQATLTAAGLQKAKTSDNSSLRTFAAQATDKIRESHSIIGDILISDDSQNIPKPAAKRPRRRSGRRR
jgi:dTMP kinase